MADLPHPVFPIHQGRQGPSSLTTMGCWALRSPGGTLTFVSGFPNSLCPTGEHTSRPGGTAAPGVPCLPGTQVVRGGPGKEGSSIPKVTQQGCPGLEGLSVPALAPPRTPHKPACSLEGVSGSNPQHASHGRQTAASCG